MKFILIEDEHSYFSKLMENIKNSGKNLFACCNLPTIHYSYNEYIELIRSEKPELLILDQKLKWRDAKDKNAEDIILELNHLYYGVKPPILILTSRSFHKEMVSKFNQMNGSSQMFTPQVNLFLLSTQTILLASEDEEDRKEVMQVLSASSLYHKQGFQLIPNCDSFINLHIPGVKFYHYLNKTQELNAISFCNIKFICMFWKSRQDKAYWYAFNQHNQMVIYELRMNPRKIEGPRECLLQNGKNIIVQQKIIFNSLYFQGEFLLPDISLISHHTSITSNFFLDNKYLMAIARQWGLIQ